MVQKRPPGNRVRTREHWHARRRADEGRRVYERGDEPAGAWVCGRVARRRSTLPGGAGQQPLHGAVSSGTLARRAPAWVWERAWARGPLATEGSPGSLPHGRAAARAPAGRRRGGARESGGGIGSRGREGRPVGGGRWGIAGERAGGRTRWGRGEREGAWATVAGDSPVGGGPWVRADGCRGGPPVGSGVDQLAVGGWHGREKHSGSGPSPGGGPGRHGGAAMGRGDARAVGERRRQESALSPAGEISRRHARIRPVRVYIYSYTHAPSPPSTTAVRHTRGDGSGYISLDGDGAADPRRR